MFKINSNNFKFVNQLLPNAKHVSMTYIGVQMVQIKGMAYTNTLIEIISKYACHKVLTPTCQWVS